MKPAITKIDRALKEVYRLELDYCAEEFLLKHPPTLKEKKGALFIQADKNNNKNLSLGIHLCSSVSSELSTFESWKPDWSKAQTAAFSVAAEEVSHFLYLIHHLNNGRAVTQLELETQGEIDKFLLIFFAKRTRSKDHFFTTLEHIFFQFKLSENLSQEEKERYLQANIDAKRFILKHRAYLENPDQQQEGFRTLRRYYRLSHPEKLAFISTKSAA